MSKVELKRNDDDNYERLYLQTPTNLLQYEHRSINQSYKILDRKEK